MSLGRKGDIGIFFLLFFPTASEIHLFLFAPPSIPATLNNPWPHYPNMGKHGVAYNEFDFALFISYPVLTQ